MYLWMSWHGNQFQARLRCLSLTADTKLVAVPATCYAVAPKHLKSITIPTHNTHYNQLIINTNKGEWLIWESLKLTNNRNLLLCWILHLISLLHRGCEDFYCWDFAESRIAKGTFYLYFKDKYDIRNRLISHESSKLFKNAVADLEEFSIKKDEPLGFEEK